MDRRFKDCHFYQLNKETELQEKETELQEKEIELQKERDEKIEIQNKVNRLWLVKAFFKEFFFLPPKSVS